MFPFFFSPWVVVEIVVCATCWRCFFGKTLVRWHGFPQYKQRLFTRWHCFSCFVNGLNYVLLICMGSSLGVDTVCLGCNMGGENCFNVGDDSQRFSCWRSKSWLSQCIACAIAWLKVVEWSMVNKRSYTSP